MYYLQTAKVTHVSVFIMSVIIIIIIQFCFIIFFRREMSFILRSSIIRAIYLALFVTFLPTTMFLMFSVHAALGEEITKRKIFVTLSLLAVFKIYFNYIFVFAVSQLSEAAVALKRIKVCLYFHLHL